MATISIYLDKRGAKGAAPLKISISKHSSSAYIGLGIKVLPSQWDKKTERVKDHPQKVQLNTFISHRRNEVQSIMMRLAIEGKTLQLNATQIKNLIQEELEPTENKTLFIKCYTEFANSRKSVRTREIYLATLHRLERYDKNLANLQLEDVTKKWLDGLENHFRDLGQSDSTISIDLRNIRAVINDAIDNELITSYVFRKKKIKTPVTRKRSLSLERLRELWNYPVEPWQERYLDFFKLTFYLIGINLVDLVNLRIMEDGRICYNRKKTTKPYYIKVEPEALEIINKYRGTDYLVNILETYKDYKTFLGRCNKGLQSIGPIKQVPNPTYKRGSYQSRMHIKHESAFPGLSLYWARHSWATLAAELEIPKETISASLGHSTNVVTDVYIKFNYQKVDDANRKVIDYLLGKTKE